MLICYLICIRNPNTLLFKQDICNSFLVERPADRVAHEREQQEINGLSKKLSHGCMLIGLEINAYADILVLYSPHKCATSDRGR